jgi:hypothetical protein
LLEGERAARLITNKAETYDSRKAKRDERERELCDKILALPDEKYGVIYADPEWKFEFWSEDGAAWSSPDNHYQTSPLDVIKARPVEKIAADDCSLWLWAIRATTASSLGRRSARRERVRARRMRKGSRSLGDL